MKRDMSSFLLIVLPFCLLSLTVDAGSGACKTSGTLTTYEETVDLKGFTYKRQMVNRSIPVSVVFEFKFDDRTSKIDSLTWTLNDEPKSIDDKAKAEVYYSIETQPDGATVTLHVKLPSSRATGNWKLTVTLANAETYHAVCEILSPPMFHTRLGAARANEGHPLTVSCDVETVPAPTRIEWFRLEESPEGWKQVPVKGAALKAKNSIDDSEIEWTDATEYGGLYLCSTGNSMGRDNLAFEVRIKTKLTYLWPSIGIILELIVLFITIGIYEYMQSKRRKQADSPSLTEPGKI